MEGRSAVGESYSMRMDEADDAGAEAVGVEGADGYEWRRSKYVVEMSGEVREGWIIREKGTRTDIL